MTAKRTQRGAPAQPGLTRVRLDDACMVLLNEQLGCGMDPLLLLHVLVGYFPDFVAEDWEMYDLLCDALNMQSQTPRWWRSQWWRSQWWHYTGGERSRARAADMDGESSRRVRQKWG